jgi:UDP-N-acetylglucosamine 2-epimerase (non-hydrolysing)
MKKVLTCVGTRPNLIKITQLHKYFSEYPDLEYKLLHTGQHFDYNMNEVFFQELGIKAPDIFLNINQGTQIDIISEIMRAFEKYILEYKPDLVMVPGDVNSSFACSFVASRHNIPVAHLESGLRSYDMSMPEEVNRILIDSVTDLYFVTEQSGWDNLVKEGKSESKLKFVGNTMIDSLIAFMPKIDASPIREKLGVDSYYLMTFHRPGNVDDPANLTLLAEMIAEMSQTKKVVFPVHPRTRKRLEENGLMKLLDNPQIVLTEPLGYIDFIHLVKNASVVITDSGGVQEETTYMGVPCITVRPNTERPVTVTEGSNTMAKMDKAFILGVIADINSGTYKKRTIPHFWDGKSSQRIVEELHRYLVK